MDAAVAALRARAIPRLFTRQPKAGSGRDSAQHKEHEGVCECQKQTLPDDWKVLRRFPVLKRFVLQEWRRQDEELRRQRETQSKRRRVVKAGRSSIGSVLNEDQSAHSMITLCRYLRQCGLLGAQDLELACSVVEMSFPIVLREVVTAPAVPLDTRMLLLAVAVQYQCTPRIKETAIEEWLQFVCDQLQQEVADRMASLSRDPQATPKRERKSAHTSDSMASKTSKHVYCEFCLHGAQEECENAIESSGYQALLGALRCVIRVFDEESNRRGQESILKSLTSLRNLLLTPEVRSWFRPADGSDKSTNHWMQLIEATSDTNATARLNLKEYMRIGDNIVSLKATQKMVCLWGKVWRKDLARFARKKNILFEDIIMHCSMADQFVICAMMGDKNQDSSITPGFQLVAEVIVTLSLNYAQTLSTFAHVSVRLSKAIKSPTAGSISICRSYLHALLQHPNRYWTIVVDRPDSTEVDGECILQLMHSTWILFAQHTLLPGETTLDARMKNEWDLILNQVNDYVRPLSGTTLGMNWLIALQLCASQVREATAMYSPAFMISIKLYFDQVLRLVIASNGAFISSGACAEHKLVTISDELARVQTVVVLIMECLDQDWLYNLITCILREQSVCQWRAASIETDLAFRNGMNNFLFPGIVAWIQRVKSLEDYTEESKHFADYVLNQLLRVVHGQLCQTYRSSRYIPSLVRFCCGWDTFQNRPTKTTNPRQPTLFASDSGLHALIQLNVLSKIVKVYGDRSVIMQERRDVQVFIAHLLEHAASVPISLDGLIQQMQTDLRYVLETPNSGKCDEEMLVSHSDEDLRDILEIFSLKDLSTIRRSVNQIKQAEEDHLDGLAQNVKRWVLLLETKDPRVELGKETKLELALHCNKLIYWFPEEFAQIRILQTSLDMQLVYTLTEFVKYTPSKTEDTPQNNGFLTNDTDPLPASSAIRLELQLRSFLSSSVLPDLSALTACVMDSMLHSETKASFQALQKWVRNNFKYLMVEIVADKVKAVLRLDSSINAPIIKIEPDHEPSIDYTRIVKNAMNLMASAETVFHPYVLEWNCSIFDEISAEHWLLCLYNAKFATFQNCDTRVDDLISCLERIVGANACASKMAHSYWLVAMLCTVLFHSQSVFASTDAVEERVQKILVQLLPILSFASDIRTDDNIGNEGDAVTIWVVHLQSRGVRCELTCAQVLHDQLMGLSSSVLERSSALAARLQDIGKHPTDETISPTWRFLLTFSTWLPTAISHSQLHADDSSSNARAVVEWEKCFCDQVVNLYLPLEFENCVSDLLTEWICIWISIDIVQAIKNTRRLLLLPFQRSLCLRLSNQYQRQSNQNQEPVWSCGFQCLHRLLEQCESSMGAIATTQMIDVFMDTVVSFDLMSIATASISAQDKQVVAMALLQEFDQLISYDYTSAWSSSKLFSWLQYPLELVVYCHICFDQDGDPHVLKAIMAHLRSERPMHTEESGYSDFYKIWEQNMLLKYAYLNDERCLEAINSIGIAFGVPETR